MFAPYVTIDTVTANSGGMFDYTDSDSSYQKRFYRLSVISAFAPVVDIKSALTRAEETAGSA